jgi:hypothetical protein
MISILIYTNLFLLTSAFVFEFKLLAKKLNV